VPEIEDPGAEAELERLRAACERDRAILGAIASGYVVTGLDGRLAHVNNVLCELLGFTAGELIGTAAPWPFWPPEGVELGFRLLEEVLGRARETGRPQSFELPLMRKDGTRFIAEVTAAAALNSDGSEMAWVSTIHDISRRRDYEAELERLANHDPLTGLANRRLFERRLAEEMTDAVRYDRSLAVAILDLDHFKHVNDHFGHPTGDRALRETAHRLSQALRSGDLLARVGGEEFAWILPEAQIQGAWAAVERARESISDVPYDEIGTLTISIGVGLRGEVRDAAELYKNADQCLYQAKRDGRNRSIMWGGEPTVG
jgi:diguanylate cyclase (GGDEF)-like protein/PAS domain S-box-containing protein